MIRRAADLADSAGFAAVSLSAVARSLSVQTPSLYSHVRDLASLRDGVSILAMGELEQRTTEAVAGRSGQDALRALCDVYRGYARAHPGRWDALQRRVGDDVAESEEAARSGQSIAAVLRGYRIEPTDTVHAIRLVASFLNGFVSLESTGAFSRSQPDTQQSWEQLVGRLHLLLTSWNEQGAHANQGEQA